VNTIIRYSYFKNWDIVTKRECSIISRTKSYNPDEVILGDNVGLPTYSYLIIKGTCSVIEHLQVVPQYVSGFKKYRLVVCGEEQCNIASFRKKAKKSGQKRAVSKPDPHKYPSLKLGPCLTRKKEREIETHFIKVCELSEGAIFNVGEYFERRRVVADTTTNCLLIPRYWLMKMNKDNIWSRVQQFLNKNIPSTNRLFDNWMKEKRFIEYRKKLVKDILATRKTSNTNCIHNVPYSLRLKENPDAFSNY